MSKTFLLLLESETACQFGIDGAVLGLGSEPDGDFFFNKLREFVKEGEMCGNDGG